MYFYDSSDYKKIEQNPKVINLKQLKNQGKLIKKNTGASLIDIGDGVALLEFHSPNNAIGLDILQMINYSVDEVAKIIRVLSSETKGRTFV